MTKLNQAIQTSQHSETTKRRPLNKTYDCIVLGCGGIGSAALRAAALRGWNAAGIDQFGASHTLGSSHGQTRIIRRTYFEHPNYVPLAEEAFQRWTELNKRHQTSLSVTPLLTESGLLQIGQPESELIQGVQRSADEHGLKTENFTPDEIMRRLPLLKIDDDHVGIFEPDAGFLRVENAVAANLAQAKKLGAELFMESPVEGWSVEGDTVVVRTGDSSFAAERLIICAGAWTNQLMPDVEMTLEILAKQQQWFQIDRVEQKLVNQFPVVLIEEPDGEQFYCLPEIDSLGMKVCRHTGGVTISDPKELDRSLDKEELTRCESFLDRAFVHNKHRMVHHSMCMYTMSKDGHFIVDRHPAHEQVSFAAGLSGHAFKFAPVIADRLVKLLDGEFDPATEFLRLERPA